MFVSADDGTRARARSAEWTDTHCLLRVASPGVAPPVAPDDEFIGGTEPVRSHPRPRTGVLKREAEIGSEVSHCVSLAFCSESFQRVRRRMGDDLETPSRFALLTRVLRSGMSLALLCHAPAATFAARNEDGSWLFAGYRTTGLSNLEEKFNSFGRKAIWLLEDRLRESGADYRKGRLPLRPFMEVDRNLYTGQNPASSELLAKRLVDDSRR